MLFFDREQVSDADELVRRVADAEPLASPTRSVVPLLDLIRSTPDVLKQILEDEFGLVGPALHLEYTVSPPADRGKASHTDLMAIQDDDAVAFEIKWTEPREQTVAKWLTPESSNRTLVLDGWLKLINDRAGTALTAVDVSDLPYQLIHRTASACATGENAKTAYLVFTSSATPSAGAAAYVAEDLAALRSLIGDASIGLAAITVALSPTPAFARTAGLPKGGAGTSDQVVDALLADRLFTIESVATAAL